MGAPLLLPIAMIFNIMFLSNQRVLIIGQNQEKICLKSLHLVILYAEQSGMSL